MVKGQKQLRRQKGINKHQGLKTVGCSDKEHYFSLGGQIKN